MAAGRSGFLLEGLLLVTALVAPARRSAARTGAPAALLHLVTMRGDLVVGVPARPDGVEALIATLRLEGEVALWRYARLRDEAGRWRWQPTRRIRLSAADALMVEILEGATPIAPLPVEEGSA
jgi:hypothetical protein